MYNYIYNTIIKDKARILEIDCGLGNIKKYLLSKRPDFDVLELPFLPNMIELAKKNNSNASFIITDVRKIDGIKTKVRKNFCENGTSVKQG
ncbi:trans-aconitate methyltransferase [Siphonobacter sp. BAB-5404]|nr:trans-aconitate methyltransferase [Siphonobacter sp. SORGH_AS_0500]